MISHHRVMFELGRKHRHVIHRLKEEHQNAQEQIETQLDELMTAEQAMQLPPQAVQEASNLV